MTYSLAAQKLLPTTIELPASKSISNRALIISAISRQNEMPENISQCDDTDVVVHALCNMPPTIDIRASGSAMRFLTSYLSIKEGKHVLTGTTRMQHRPIKVLVDSLLQLGADISYIGQEGFPPLMINGKTLDGGFIQVAGDVSSQYISSLLMIGPTMQNGLTIHLLGTVISRSYIDLTISMMQEYGADVEWTSVDTIEVKPQPYKPTHYFIESDWTAASYWYEALALATNDDAELHLTGLMDASAQGDSTVKYIFSLLGVKTTFQDKTKKVPTTVVLQHDNRQINHLVLDFNNCPDIAQTLVCTCCGLGIPFDFTGLSTLKIKETDRIVALQTELRKLGFVLSAHDDSRLTWDGERCEASMEAIDTYEDHRMAMAFAPLALRIKGLQITAPEVVSKSYPNFWEHLRKASFIISEE